MNKKIIYLIVAIALAIGGAYYLSTRQSTPPSQTPQPNTTSTSTPSAVDIFKGELGSFGVPSSTFVNTTTGDLVSFRLLTEDIYQARNPSFDVYLNQEKITPDKLGKVVGQGISMLGFSPDNQHFSWRSRSVSGCAGTCHAFTLGILDLQNKKIIEVGSPKSEKDYTGSVNSVGQSIIPFIDSYQWNSAGTLKIIFYFVKYSNDQYYKASPEETWIYDLTKKQYSLL